MGEKEARKAERRCKEGTGAEIYWLPSNEGDSSASVMAALSSRVAFCDREEWTSVS